VGQIEQPFYRVELKCAPFVHLFVADGKVLPVKIVTAQFSARGGIALTVCAEYPNAKSRKPDRDGL
jgi:hypothetical protein